MGNLATVKKILSKSHFDESRISRDSHGRFAPKSTSAIDKIAAARIKEIKADPYLSKYLSVGDGGSYEQIAKNEGHKAAEAALRRLAERYARRKIEEQQPNAEKTSNSPAISFDHDSIMQRGVTHTQRLEASLSNAKSESAQLGVMRRYRDKLKQGISDKEAADLVGQKDISSLDLKSQKITKGAAEDFYKITGGLGGSIKTFKLEGNRASANAVNSSVNIGNYTSPATIFHEMGHHIEFENKDILKAAADWRDRRATGGIKPLKDIDKSSLYDNKEVAKPGKYIHPYIGKVYQKIFPWGTVDFATEVISTGIEHFSSPKRMLHLYNKDKEHFQFIIGIIRRD